MLRALFRFVPLLAAVFLLIAPLTGQQEMQKVLQTLVIDPFDPDIMWGATRVRDQSVADQNARGAYTSTVYVSTDRGQNWLARRMPWGFRDTLLLHMDARNRGTIYAVLNETGDFIWRSDDGGDTWKLAIAGITETRMAGPFHLHSDPDQTALYLQLGNTLYKSTDKGDQWTRQAEIPCRFQLEVNLGDPSRMFCAAGIGDQIARSTDEGKTWQQGPRINSSRGAFGSMVNARVFSSASSPNTLVISLFGIVNNLQEDSVYRSTNGGASVTTMANMPGLHRAYASADRGVVIVTGSGGNSRRTTNLGQSWTTVPDYSSYGTLVFAPSDSRLVWSSSPRRHSTNGGISFDTVNGQVEVIVMPPGEDPVTQTLRRGTVFHTSLPFRDSDRDSTLLRVVNASTPAPWLQWQGNNSFIFDAAAAEPGEYAAVHRMGNASHTTDVEIRLTVTPPEVPAIPLRLETVYGNGATYPAAAVNTPGPIPGEGGIAKQTPFACCGTVAVGEDGTLYQSTGRRVLKISPDGVITSIAGNGELADSNIGDAEMGKPALEAKLGRIAALLPTPQGLLMADTTTNHIWRLGQDGRLERIYSRAANGIGSPFVNFDPGLAVDAAGVIHFTGSGGVLRVGANGQTQQVVANSAFPGSPGSLSGLHIRPDGSMIVLYTRALYRRSAQGVVSRIAGNPGVAGFAGDGGPAADSLLSDARALGVDGDGNIFIADGQRVRVVTPAGRIDTVIGNGDTLPPLRDGAVAVSASASRPYGIAFDPDGRLVFSAFAHTYRALPLGETAGPEPNEGGAVSLAAGSPQVAPGAIFSIYGVNMSSAAAEAHRAPLPTLLAGAEVRVNGRAVPLFYVSPLQINAQMPEDTEPGTVNVQVVRDGKVSGNVTVEVVAGAPDVLHYDGGRAVALDEEYKLVGPDNPLKAGKYVMVYLTGIGPVSPPVAMGAPAPSSPLSYAALPSSATIGGQETDMIYLGLAPGFVGLAQANILVPEGLAAGDHELIITVDGRRSNAVTLRVTP